MSLCRSVKEGELKIPVLWLGGSKERLFEDNSSSLNISYLCFLTNHHNLSSLNIATHDQQTSIATHMWHLKSPRKDILLSAVNHYTGSNLWLDVEEEL